MADFKVESKFSPTGDQPTAISELSDGLNNNVAHQTLLGVTGSGKTYTVAKVIEEVQKPTLVISLMTSLPKLVTPLILEKKSLEK